MVDKKNKVMKKCFMFLLVVVLVVSCGGSVFATLNNPLPDTYQEIGKGCTTAYYIDEDCDGYGVGTGYVFGVDADDNDATINTLASVEAVYGEMDSGDSATAKLNLLNFLANRQATSYTGIGDVYYISTTGNDVTGQPNDYNYPFATFNDGVKNDINFGSSDLVIFRDGIFTSYLNLDWVDGLTGSSIIFMSFPGEKATVIYQYLSPASSVWFASSSYIILDTFQFGTDTPDLVYYSQGIAKDSSDETHHIEIRYVECLNNYQGTRLQYNFHDVIFENSVVHDNTVESGNHLNYWGGVNCYNQIIRDNIFYANRREYQLFHWNGLGDNIMFDGCIFHSSGQVGLDFMDGVQNSVVKNCLFFNNNGNDILLYVYDNQGLWPLTTNDNNIFVNNIFWRGSTSNQYSLRDPSDFSSIKLANSYDLNPQTGNVFRNNLFFTYDGQIIDFSLTGSADGSTVDHNIMYRQSGTTISSVAGTDYTLSEFEATFANVNNNLFSDPLLTDVSVNYNLNPENFNFDLTSSSPAINFGTLIGAPLYDLRGNLRDSQPDAGCYEYTGVITYECSDTIDNDGDGQIDFPNDAGCIDSNDNDETNCGDLVCEGGETCTSCVADCPIGVGQVCCSGVLYTGDCCSDTDCVSPNVCTNNVCSEPAVIPGICEGLNLLMHFDEDSSTIIDDSGSGNDGTVNGATFTSSGKFSGAFEYDGVDDYVEVNNNPSLQFNGQSFSVSAWVKLNSIAWVSGTIASKDNLNYGDQFPWRLNSYGSNAHFNIIDSGGTNQGVSDTSGPLSTSDYSYVVGTFDPNGYLRIYVDGVEKDSLDVSGITFDSSSGILPLRIGILSYVTAYQMNGTIDEVAVWNRSLSATEILDLYNSGVPITCTTTSTCGPADTDIDGVVSITEIMAYITEWKAGNVDIVDLMAGITEWKSGCV